MAAEENVVREGDHVVFTGVKDEETGGEKAIVYHDDGTTDDVVSTKEGKGQDCVTAPCGEFSDMPNVRHVVGTGTGHRGPAIVNCEAFRRGFDLIQWRSREDAEGPGLSD